MSTDVPSVPAPRITAREVDEAVRAVTALVDVRTGRMWRDVTPRMAAVAALSALGTVVVTETEARAERTPAVAP